MEAALDCSKDTVLAQTVLKMHFLGYIDKMFAHQLTCSLDLAPCNVVHFSKIKIAQLTGHDPAYTIEAKDIV